MVLCAGLGTRLRPLTDERPKPLVPLLDHPIASYALEHLARHGVRHVVANAHHLAAQIEPALTPYTQRLGQSLTVFEERTILGTGGGILNALPALGGEDFVVFNGDVLAAPDLTRACVHHRTTGALMTLVLREDPRAERAGVIELSADGRVVRMLNEGPAAPVATRRCLFTGIYVLSSAIAPMLPTEGCIVRHTLRQLLARGAPVAGILDDGPWYDLGTVAHYAEANFAMLRGTLRNADVVAPAHSCYIGPGAHYSEATLDHDVVLGTNARLVGRGAVREAIVWDGAHSTAPCERVIVSRTHRVPLDG